MRHTIFILSSPKKQREGVGGVGGGGCTARLSLPRDQILRRKRGLEKNIVPVQLTTGRIDNHTRLIDPLLLYVMTIHT